MVLSLIEGRGE